MGAFSNTRTEFIKRLAAAPAPASSKQANKPKPNTMAGMSEEEALRSLTNGSVRDQAEYEREITLRANAALMEAEDKKDSTRIEKLDAARQRLQTQLDKEKKALEKAADNPYKSRKAEKEIARLDDEVNRVKGDISDFQARMAKRHNENPVEETRQTNQPQRRAGESQRDFLIRTGKITPFTKLGGDRPLDFQGSLADSILDAEEEAIAQQYQQDTTGPMSHQTLRRPGFADAPVKPTPRASVEPVRRASNVPPRRPSILPGRRASNVPARRATILPGRRASVLPGRRASVEPVLQASVEPARQASVEPARQASIVPARRPSVVPARRGSTISSRASVEPARQASVESTRQASVESARQASVGPSRASPAPSLVSTTSSRVPATSAEAETSLRPLKKRRMQQQRKRSPSADYEPDESSGTSENGDSVVLKQQTEDDVVRDQRRKAKSKKNKDQNDDEIDLSSIDDGNEAHYKRRLKNWVERRSRARRARREAPDSGANVEESDDEMEEWFKPAPDYPDHQINDDLKVPGDIHPSLFGYQKTGLQWLAELYKQGVGGIVGDEMGLGKTVQLIAFIAALHCSGKLNRPVIIVAPATLLRQWVSEFHRWWPPMRVSILHASGSGMMNPRIEDESDVDSHRPVSKWSLSAVRKMVKGVVEKGHVLITTYTGLQTYADELLPVAWEYAVLDEGHKIRNPNAEVTVTCKELNTPNRIILSGTPAQNNLTELWSLFDFIYPMRLGTLVNFRAQFEIPIRQGGYANASNLQVMTAEKCAEALKETISEYLLQRLKADVAADLPEKTEQVLFCRLTEGQREKYEEFLGSDAVSAILNKRKKSLYGIDILRKICNHPDLLDKSLERKAGYNYGDPQMSTKLQLTRDLLENVMIPNGHKTLLFSQGKLMLNIIEKFIRDRGISFLRMDGETPVDQRQPMIDRFNTDPNIHVFLMTTRTGGLGTNLTGADRIIIFDPDWNPSTDLQARERAWRLGQSKPVKIYRLMTEGTIEEKIYHRQVFKQFMTNKVLKDPKQRSSYDLSDLYDLFSYNRDEDAARQRSEVFKGAEVGLVADAEAIEVQHMDSVAAVQAFQEDQSAHDERRMLEGIFARSVKSAYDHDQIVNGPAKKLTADMAVLRQEAEQLGRQAAAHLRRAAEDARSVPIGTVTWTGEVGEGGRPGMRRGAAVRGRAVGPGSAAVLNNLADRQGLGGARRGAGAAGGQAGANRAASGPAQGAGRDFGALIKAFVMRHGGRVPSKMLVDHFNPLCPGKKQSIDFKTALGRVAVMSKVGGTGRGMWSLRPGIK